MKDSETGAAACWGKETAAEFLATSLLKAVKKAFASDTGFAPSCLPSAVS